MGVFDGAKTCSPGVDGTRSSVNFSLWHSLLFELSELPARKTGGIDGSDSAFGVAVTSATLTHGTVASTILVPLTSSSALTQATSRATVAAPASIADIRGIIGGGTAADTALVHFTSSEAATQATVT